MDQMGAMMEQVAAMMTGGSTNPPAVVNFRELKALLPEAVGELPRVNAEGQTQNAMGMAVSESTGTYGSDDGPSLTIKLIDTGGVGGFMSMAKAGWAGMDFESESDTGFERTSMYKGFKAHETYDEQTKVGSCTIMADRFMVEINSDGLPYTAVEQARDAINLDGLKSLTPDAEDETAQ